MNSEKSSISGVTNKQGQVIRAVIGYHNVYIFFCKCGRKSLEHFQQGHDLVAFIVVYFVLSLKNMDSPFMQLSA